MANETRIGATRSLLDRIPEAIRSTIEQVPPSEMVEDPEEAAERRERAVRHRLNAWLRRLPKKYAEASCGDLEPEQDPDGQVARWLASGHQTLLLASEKPGLGKTHAAYAVGNEAAKSLGLWTEGWSAMDLLGALRPNPRDPDGPGNTLDHVVECDLLILDDLGRENATAWAQEQLHYVLDARLREERRTIITTNLTAPEMGERYGYPMLDRIIDDAVIVKVTGESRRRQAAW